MPGHATMTKQERGLGYDHYVIREKWFRRGHQYEIRGPQGQPVAYCHHKGLRAKEDIRFYTDATMEHELFRLETSKVLDFNADLKVVDSTTGAQLGILRRKGVASLLKRTWHVHDAQGRHEADLLEDNVGFAIVRRLTNHAYPPDRYFLKPHGDKPPVAEIRERLSLIGDTYDLRLDRTCPIDVRVLMSLAICMDAIEGE